MLVVAEHCYHTHTKKSIQKRKEGPSWFNGLKSLNPSGFVLFLSNENELHGTKIFHEDNFIYLWTRATLFDRLGWKSQTSWMSGSLTSCHLTLFKWDTNKYGVKKCQ